MGLNLSGEYRGDEWGAVVVAQWEFAQGGSVTRLLIPPAAIAAIRAPKTFAKIEITAAYRMKGHSRRLYAALADKKNLKHQTWWEYDLPELRAVMDAVDKYPRWVDFSRYVLIPAVGEINDFGTVDLKTTIRKRGRSVSGVRFDWKWKDIREAERTDSENNRHSDARRKKQINNSAPPLSENLTNETDEYQPLSDEEMETRRKSADKVMKEYGFRK